MNRRTCGALLVGMFALGGCIGVERPRESISSGQVAVRSPDGTIEMTIRANGGADLLRVRGWQAVIAESRLGLRFRDGATLGAKTRLVKVERSRGDATWENRLGKRRVVRDRSNELRRLLRGAIGPAVRDRGARLR